MWVNREVSRIQFWEIWRLTRGDLFQRFAAVVLLTLFMRAMADLPLERANHAFLQPIVLTLANGMCLAIASFPLLFGGADLRGSGIHRYVRRGFTMPIATGQLIGVPLAYGLAASVSLYILAVGFIQAVFGEPLPVLAPVSFAAAVSTWLFCLFASWGSVLFLLFAASGFLYVFLLPGAADLRAIPMHPEEWSALFTFSRRDFAVLAAFSVGAAACTAWDVDRQRHEGVKGAGLGRSSGEAAAAGPVARRKPFRSPLSAQLWMEFRRVRDFWRIVALGVPITIGTTFASHGLGFAEYPAIFVWTMAIVMCRFVFILGAAASLSGMSPQSGFRRYSSFEASQAITIGRSIALKAAVVFGVNLLGSLAFFGAAWFTWRWFPLPLEGRSAMRLQAAAELLSDSYSTGFIAACILVCAAVAFACVLLALCAGYKAVPEGESRDDLYAIVLSLAVAAYTVVAILDLAAGWNLGLFWAVHAWAIAALLIWKTVRGLWRVWHGRLIRPVALACAVGGWAVFVIAFGWVVLALQRAADGGGVAWNVHLLVFCAGLLSIPLGCVAWAPLALAERRSA